MLWLTDYTGNASQPQITNDDLTASSYGANAVPGSWSVGSALGDTATTQSKQTLVGTTGAGGTIVNTIHGLTYISTAAGLDGVSLSVNATYVLAAIRMNEAGDLFPQVNGLQASSDTTSFTSGHEYTITDTGTTITFADNGVVWYTESYTNVGGATRPFCAAYATAVQGTFTLAEPTPPASSGTRLPPPPIVLGGL